MDDGLGIWVGGVGVGRVWRGGGREMRVGHEVDVAGAEVSGTVAWRACLWEREMRR